MATKVVEKGNGVVELSTSLKGESWKAANNKAIKKLAEKITIKGFRKGKAPMNLVKERINPSDQLNEAINASLNEAYNNALKEANVRPYNNPQVNITSVDADGYEVTFIVTKVPEVKLGQYKGIEVAREVVKVSAKEVQESIDKLLADNAELVLKDGPAAMGDTVVFDFKGYVNGKEFEGGSADNYSLVLGSNQFIPGFEDQLVGAKEGEKRDVLVTFPEQYVKDLAGKDAKFVCMVHEIKEKSNPVLDDDFVAGLNYKDVKTVEDLKKYQKAKLEDEKNREADRKHFDEILEKIVAGATVVIPDAVLADEAQNSLKNLINQIEQNGLSFEQYQQITGQNEAAIIEQFKKDALPRLTRYFVLNQVGRDENLVITKQDVDNYYANVAKQYNMDVEKVRNILKQNEQNIVEELFQNKVTRFVLANNGELAKEEAKEEAPKAKKAPAKKAAPKAKKEAPVAEEKPAEAPKAKKAPAKKAAPKAKKEEKAE
ncbi:MAG: trigger factor [Bacilli bacterium]|nr:trigger factor [Bacilli bacterium]